MTPTLSFLGHATVETEMAGLRIITNPMLTNQVGLFRRVDDILEPETMHADVILLSQHHSEYFHVASLQKFNKNAVVVGPPGTAALVAKIGIESVHELKPGEYARIDELTVTATPAYTDGRQRRWRERTAGIGFLMEADDWTTYYAGDTSTSDEMWSLRPVDLAILPVWGRGFSVSPGHMDPAEATEAVRMIQPRIAVPIQWGTFWPVGCRHVRAHLLEQPPLQFRHHVKWNLLPTKVEIVQPGASLDLSEVLKLS